MSDAPENSKSLHGVSSLNRGSQVFDVDLNAEVESETTTSSSAETEDDLVNSDMASRSSLQRRLSFSLYPSSDDDYPNRLKSDAAQVTPPQIKKVPVSANKVEEPEEEEEVKKTWNLRPRKRGKSVFPAEACGGGASEEEEEEEEEVKKTWNLRSKKIGNGGFPAEACGGGDSEVKNQEFGGGMELRSKRQRRIPAESPGLSGGVKENHRLWISLSREEIEEDLFIITGNRPSRRPRKRTKTLQKRLDVIFPGKGLVGKNADCFKVSDYQAKR